MRPVGILKLLVAFALVVCFVWLLIDVVDPNNVQEDLVWALGLALGLALYMRYLVLSGVADYKGRQGPRGLTFWAGLVIHTGVWSFVSYQAIVHDPIVAPMPVVVLVQALPDWLSAVWKKGNAVQAEVPIVRMPDPLARVVVTVRIQEMEWYRLNLILFLGKPIVLFLMVTSLLGGGVLAFRDHTMAFEAYAIIGATLCVLFCCILLPLATLWQAKKQLGTNPILSGDTTYVIDDDSLHVRAHGLDVRWEWMNVKGVRETREWLMVLTGPNTGFFLPKRSISERELEQIKAWSGSTVR